MCVLKDYNTWQNASQGENEKKGEKGSELSDRIKIPQQICAYVKSLFFGSAAPLQRIYMLSTSKKKKAEERANFYDFNF